MCFCCQTKAQRSLTREEKFLAKKEYITLPIFPAKFYLLCTFINIASSIIMIAFQILSILYESPMYYVGIGIWVGLIILFIEIYNVYFGKYIYILIRSNSNNQAKMF